MCRELWLITNKRDGSACRGKREEWRDALIVYHGRRNRKRAQQWVEFLKKWGYRSSVCPASLLEHWRGMQNESSTFNYEIVEFGEFDTDDNDRKKPPERPKRCERSKIEVKSIKHSIGGLCAKFCQKIISWKNSRRISALSFCLTLTQENIQDRANFVKGLCNLFTSLFGAG